MTSTAAGEFVRASREEPGPRDRILDLYGSFIRDHGGWVAVGDLLRLLEAVDVSAASGRSALSRMKRRGELVTSTVDGRRGYRLSASADQWFADGTVRIMSAPPAADNGWALAAFTVPEAQRSVRYRIRSRLGALGYGQISGGLMIAPGRILAETVRALDRAGLRAEVDLWRADHVGGRDVVDLVAAAWDLAAIRRAYDQYLHTVAALERKATPTTEREAFVTYLRNVNAWRELPFLDPGLPLGLLPDDWPRQAAWHRFDQLTRRLRPAATRHFLAVAGGEEGAEARSDAGAEARSDAEAEARVETDASADTGTGAAPTAT